MLNVAVACWADEAAYVDSKNPTVYVPGAEYVAWVNRLIDKPVGVMLGLSDGSARFDPDWMLEPMAAITNGAWVASCPVDGQTPKQAVSPAACVVDIARLRSIGGIDPRLNSFAWDRYLEWAVERAGGTCVATTGPGVTTQVSTARTVRLGEVYYDQLSDLDVVEGIIAETAD